MTQDAVRPIRIAAALEDRMTQIMRGSTDRETYELRIGEAQQIYPEAWRHLDEARAIAAAAGRDLRAYDGIRAAQHPGMLGVTDAGSALQQADASATEQLAAVATLAALGVDMKVARFNEQGLRDLRHGRTALMAVLPEIDWATLERNEAAELAAVGSLSDRKGMVRGLAMVAGLVAVLVIAYYVLR